MLLIASEKIALASAIIGGISALIAFYAASRSRRANKIAAEALELGKRAFSIAVKSQRENDGLLLSSVGAEQEINNLTIYFPRKFNLEPIILISGNLKLLDIQIVRALRDYWDSRTPESPGQASVRPNVPIPVVIEIHGHTKGVATITKGIYDLYSQYVLLEGISSLTVLALVLNNYALKNDDPQALANQLVSNMESFSKSQP